MTTNIAGVLEIDHDRGVVYFHASEMDIALTYGTVTLFRICQLPSPIPEGAIDITHLVGMSVEPVKRDSYGRILES